MTACRVSGAVGRTEGEAKEQKGFGGRKVMGLWGSQNESKL